jgi:glycosyltransferase involved in cell wall biosynthesis
MRILYIDLDREWRGGQSQALLTLRGLRERGHDAHLLTVRHSPLAGRAEAAGVPTHVVIPWARRASASVLLRRLLAQQHFALLHLNEPHGLTAAWLAGAQKKAAMVVSRRVAYPLKQGEFARARYLAAHRILTVSRFVKKSVLDSYLPADMAEVVYEGVEVPSPATLEARRNARQHWGVSEQETLFGCVGYLLPEKGQELVVRAFPAVLSKFPGSRLLFAGDGPSRPRLEALSREFGLKEAIIFVGFVEDVTQVYAALDAFVFPSLAEPLGTSLLTAMAWGLPVLAVASGGVPEYVEDGETGLLVAQPDPRLFSAGMLRLLSEPEFAKRLGAAARTAIQERFTADRMVENTIRVYEDVLRRRQSA